MKIENISFTNLPCITYYIGSNAQNNFDIIDIASPEDIWIHASNNVSSCHVIITNIPIVTKKQKNKIIKKGIQLCKQNTNKLISQKNVEFIYTKVKFIHKTEKKGQVIVSNEKKFIL
jgi:hypothetical protein